MSQMSSLLTVKTGADQQRLSASIIAKHPIPEGRICATGKTILIFLDQEVKVNKDVALGRFNSHPHKLTGRAKFKSRAKPIFSNLIMLNGNPTRPV